MDVEVIDNTLGVAHRINEVAVQKCVVIGKRIQAHIKKGLTGTRSGAKRRVPGTKRFYNVSLPGDWPALRTGALQKSIHSAVEVIPGGYMAVVYSAVPYSEWLEFGTKRMAARPHFIRGWMRARDEVAKILARDWKL